MHSQKPQGTLKPREPRRRVVLPARLRDGSSWSDACILNLSSRGLMIHTGRDIQLGSRIELRRGKCGIVARVVWREGGRAGLESEEQVPIEEIMALGQSPYFQVTAFNGERRKHPRAEGRRLARRAIDFAMIAVIATSLAGAGLTMVKTAFAQPLNLVFVGIRN